MDENVAVVHKDVRPLINDHVDFFPPSTPAGLQHLKERIAFFVRKLHNQSGTLVYFYNLMGTFRNYYVALKVWCEIQDIINRGGNYLAAFKATIFADSDIANFVFIEYVKHNRWYSIDNAVQLQVITKIPYAHLGELRNSYDLALEAEARLKLETLSTSNDPMNPALSSLAIIGKGRKLPTLELITEAILSSPVKMQ